MRLDDAPDILIVAELAKLLRCGKNQAYDLCKRGEIRCVHVGRANRIPRSAGEDHLEGGADR